MQRYEGASTIFGQWTLNSYIDKYGSLVGYLADNATGVQPPSDPAPPDLSGKAISLQTGVVFDYAGIGKAFGDVLTDVRSASATELRSERRKPKPRLLRRQRRIARKPNRSSLTTSLSFPERALYEP